jgi:alkylation response protein AidB-like acyl-CoA dehydrogenase
VSRAIPDGTDAVHVKAAKGWVTSAGHAEAYVVSCLAPDDTTPTDSNLYLLAAGDDGLHVGAPWNGLGLRGNASSPMEVDATVGEDRRLGGRGEGFRLMMEVVLPWFNLGNAAVSVGLARSALDAAVGHCRGARFEHLGSTLADLPTIRARLAKAAVALASSTALLRQTAASMAAPDDGTLLAVLGVKAGANEMALEVTDEAMRVCGGAAFSKHLPVERAFRDARAGYVMAPTSDALFDFYGRALCGLDLF